MNARKRPIEIAEEVVGPDNWYSVIISNLDGKIEVQDIQIKYIQKLKEKMKDFKKHKVDNICLNTQRYNITQKVSVFTQRITLLLTLKDTMSSLKIEDHCRLNQTNLQYVSLRFLLA